MNYFERAFQELQPKIKKNTVQNVYLTEQPFLSKITTDLSNFSQSLYAIDFQFYMQGYNI